MVYSKPTKAIITDAGFASRFLPWTKTNPKAMAPFGNKPIMQLNVEEMVAAGINDIIIVTTPEGQPIYQDYFTNAIINVRKQLKVQGKQGRYDEVQHVLDFPRIRVIVQDQSLPYGNGSPILAAKDFIAPDEAFLVVYSDDVVFGKSDAETLLESFERNRDASAIIMAQDVKPSEVDKYGIVSLRNDAEGRQLLDNIVEKPVKGTEPSTLASYGRYLLTPEVFDYLKPNQTGKDGELWTVDAITKMAARGNVYVEKTRGQWRTTGDPKNYSLASLEYLFNNEDYASEVVNAVLQYTLTNPSKYRQMVTTAAEAISKLPDEHEIDYLGEKIEEAAEESESVTE